MNQTTYNARRQDTAANFSPLFLERIRTNPIAAAIFEAIIGGASPYAMLEVAIEDLHEKTETLSAVIDEMPGMAALSIMLKGRELKRQSRARIVKIQSWHVRRTLAPDSPLRDNPHFSDLFGSMDKLRDKGFPLDDLTDALLAVSGVDGGKFLREMRDLFASEFEGKEKPTRERGAPTCPAQAETDKWISETVEKIAGEVELFKTHDTPKLVIIEAPGSTTPDGTREELKATHEKVGGLVIALTTGVRSQLVPWDSATRGILAAFVRDFLNGPASTGNGGSNGE